MLNEKLSKRADDATKDLISKGKDLEEKLAVWSDIENALNCTRERELNLRHQKEMLESRLSAQMEELGELEKDRDIQYNRVNKLDKEYAVMKNKADK